MERLTSDTRTNRRVTCILNKIGWRRGVLGCVSSRVSVGVSGHSFSCSPQFCSCLKLKACNESKDVNMDILLLANWQNCLKR